MVRPRNGGFTVGGDNTVEMAWDSSRPVPWERLMREWVVYAAIMTVVFLVFFRGGNMVGAIAGVLISGPLYLLLGFVLAKFGYQRKTIKEMREQAAARSTADDAEPATEQQRSRPAPTKRTSQGSNRPSGPKRKRR